MSARFSFEGKFEFWKLILKISSIPSDLIRAKFCKVAGLITNDQRLIVQFDDGKQQLIGFIDRFQVFSVRIPIERKMFSLNISFEMPWKVPPSNLLSLQWDICSMLFYKKFIQIIPTNEMMMTNLVLIAVYGHHQKDTTMFLSLKMKVVITILLNVLEKLLEEGSNETLQTIIDKLVQHCNDLIDIQSDAYQHYYLRRRSTVRLNLMIKFLRITRSSDRIRLEKLPTLWIIN